MQETSDIGFAAALHCQDIKPISLNEENPNRILFQYKMDKDRFKALENEYFGGALSVSAQEYYGALKTLKSRIYASR